MKPLLFLPLLLVMSYGLAQNPPKTQMSKHVDAVAALAGSLIKALKKEKKIPGTNTKPPVPAPSKSSEAPSVSEVGLSPVAQKLFHGVASKLTNDGKNKVAAASKFAVSKSDKNLFSFEGDDEAPFAVEVIVTDLNDDGTEEIIFQWGNSYWSGQAGTSCLLLVKNPKNGSYEQNLGFPGIAEIRDTKTNGYRDLLIGGPGFEFPVYKWNGKSYEQKGTVKQ